MHWRLLCVWVTGILLTLGLCKGRSVGPEDYFESTTADYDYDNATFEYYFFSNGTGTINYDVYEVLHGTGTEKSNTVVDSGVKSTSGVSGKASGIPLSSPIILLALPIQRLFYSF